MARIFDRKSRQFINVTLNHEHGRDVEAARLTMTADTGKSSSCILLGMLVSVAHCAIRDHDIERLGHLMDFCDYEPVDCIGAGVVQLIDELAALAAAQVAAE